METKETLLQKLSDKEILWLSKNLCSTLGILETVTLNKLMEYSLESPDEKFAKQFSEICEDTRRSRFEIKKHLKILEKEFLVEDAGKGLFGIKYFIIKWENILKIING
jgi:hypothetical protein